MSELNDDVTPLIFGRPKPEQAAQPEAAPDRASTDAGGVPAEAAAEVYGPVADQPTWLWPDAADTSPEPTPDALADGPGDPGSAGELAENVEPVESPSEPWLDTGLARSAEPVAEAESVARRAEVSEDSASEPVAEAESVARRAEASEDSASEPVAEAESVARRAEASEDAAPQDGSGGSAAGEETGLAAAAGDPAGGLAVADGVASPAGGEDTWPGFAGGGVDEAADGRARAEDSAGRDAEDGDVDAGFVSDDGVLDEADDLDAEELAVPADEAEFGTATADLDAELAELDEAEDTDPYAAAVGDVDELATEDDSAEFGAAEADTEPEFGAETVTEPQFADASGAADDIPAGNESATSAGEANQTAAAEPNDEGQGAAGEFTLNLTETADEAESTYGHPEVDAVVQRLAELDQLETADHIEVYEDAHHRLHEALLAAGKDEGAAGGSPSDYA